VIGVGAGIEYTTTRNGTTMDVFFAARTSCWRIMSMDAGRRGAHDNRGATRAARRSHGIARSVMAKNEKS